MWVILHLHAHQTQVTKLIPLPFNGSMTHGKNRKYYGYMRLDYETWYVMRLHYDLDDQNNVTPIFKRGRIVKLVDGCYSCCSCGLHTHIGVSCVHVATTIDEMTVFYGT